MITQTHETNILFVRASLRDSVQTVVSYIHAVIWLDQSMYSILTLYIQNNEILKTMIVIYLQRASYILQCRQLAKTFNFSCSDNI